MDCVNQNMVWVVVTVQLPSDSKVIVFCSVWDSGAIIPRPLCRQGPVADLQWSTSVSAVQCHTSSEGSPRLLFCSVYGQNPRI